MIKIKIFLSIHPVYSAIYIFLPNICGCINLRDDIFMGNDLLVLVISSFVPASVESGSGNRVVYTIDVYVIASRTNSPFIVQGWNTHSFLFVWGISCYAARTLSVKYYLGVVCELINKWVFERHTWKACSSAYYVVLSFSYFFLMQARDYTHTYTKLFDYNCSNYNT